jgi:DNA invertase Pin-like site-specific DNA recombinase
LKGEILSPRPPITIAYLGASSSDQPHDSDRASALRFVNLRQFGQVIFVEEKMSDKKNWQERRIKTIIDNMKKADRIIVPELTRLGRSTVEILEILKGANDKEVDFYSVNEGFELSGATKLEITSKMLAVLTNLEKKFASIRAKNALKARKAAGARLGRPRGPGKSKLDKYRKEIITLLKNGSTKAFVAKRYGTTLPNLYNWLNKNQIDAKPVTDKIG